MKFFETHCHLHEEVFDKDRDEIVARMGKMGVVKFLTIGTSPEDCIRALRVRDQYPDMCLVSVAIDPTSTQQYVGNPKSAEKDFEKIAKLAREHKISAVGETGLDRYWRDSDFTPESLEIQHLLFELHIDLAQELNLPLVIHQREALSLTLNTLKEKNLLGTKDKKAGVFHSFTGDVEDARRIKEIGFYLGINGIVTFKTASKLQGAVANLEPEDILYETDAPFLTPEPYRGQRNDPTFIPTIAEFVESLQKKEVSDQVYENSLNLFKQ